MNWPPAKIFMGDVGSGFLGYVLAVLALTAISRSPVALLAWLALGSMFFVDTSITLARRLLRRERVPKSTAATPTSGWRDAGARACR